jgi:hypothetical protein
MMPNGAMHGMAGASHNHLPSALVKLTYTLQRLYGFRQLRAGEITVQFIPVPKPGVVLDNVGNVVPASVEIIFV